VDNPESRSSLSLYGGAMPPPKQQIAARLHQAAEHRHAAGSEVPFAARGLVVDATTDLVIVLTIDDIARIAAICLTSATDTQ
jgi:hypothetical protein